MGDAGPSPSPSPSPPPSSAARSLVVAIPLFERFTALDAIGPYELLHVIPGIRVVFLGHEPGELLSADNGMLKLSATASFHDIARPDIVIVPGGPGCFSAAKDPAFVAWIKQAHETSLYTTSVCTGSIILASAGLLDGLEATTHWSCYGDLANLGATPTDRRVVKQGKIITAAGVSSGIDMALHLIADLKDEETAKMIQLFVEYDPQPPFDAGSPAKAGHEILTKTIELAESFVAPLSLPASE